MDSTTSSPPPPRVLYRVAADSPLALVAAEAVACAALGNGDRSVLANRISSASQASSSTSSSSSSSSRIDFGTRELRALRSYLGTPEGQSSAQRHSKVTVSTVAKDGVLGSLLAASSAKVKVDGGGGVSEAMDEDTPEGRAAKAAAVAAAEEYARAKEAWRAEMRARAEHRAYNSLVSDVRRAEAEAEKERQQGLAGTMQQASLGGSVLIVLFSAALLGYFAGRVLSHGDESVVSDFVYVCEWAAGGWGAGVESGEGV